MGSAIEQGGAQVWLRKAHCLPNDETAHHDEAVRTVVVHRLASLDCLLCRVQRNAVHVGDPDAKVWVPCGNMADAKRRNKRLTESLTRMKESTSMRGCWGPEPAGLGLSSGLALAGRGIALIVDSARWRSGERWGCRVGEFTGGFEGGECWKNSAKIKMGEVCS